MTDGPLTGLATAGSSTTAVVGGVGRVIRWGTRPPVPLRGAWRTTLLVGLLGQSFAALLLVRMWSTYDSPWAVAGVWGALALVLPGLVLSAARRQTLPSNVVVVVGVLVIVAADVVVPAMAPPGGRLAAHGWNWGAVALVLLGASAYVPLGVVVAGMLGHAAAAIGWGVVSAGETAMPWLGLVNTVASCLLAPVAAVAFLHDYRGVLERRESAARRRRALQVRTRSETAAAADAARRLASIQRDVVPLLDKVVAGARIPLDPSDRRLAGQLAESLRATLARSEDHPTLVLPPGLPERLPISVSIVGSSDESLDQSTGRAIVDVACQLLERPGWDRAGLSLRPAVAPNHLLLTVVAVGEAATSAANDPALLSALARLQPGLQPMTETEPPTLTVQTTIRTTPGTGGAR